MNKVVSGGAEREVSTAPQAASVPGSTARMTPARGMAAPVRVAGERVREGHGPVSLLERLGERLSFERMSARMYEALATKLERCGTFESGPRREDLMAIREEEVGHIGILRHAIEKLGGDPRELGRAARVVRVANSGVFQVIVNPRTSLAQGLEAMLMVERADCDGWHMLIEMARAVGEHRMSDSFYLASTEEERHVELLRRWVTHHALQDVIAGAEVLDAA